MSAAYKLPPFVLAHHHVPAPDASGEPPGNGHAVGNIERRRTLKAIGQLGEGLGDPDAMAELVDAPWDESARCHVAMDELGEMSLGEIGFLLGMHKQTVKKIYDRALAKMRMQLKETGHIE